MGYQVNYDALDAMYYGIQGQVVQWNEAMTEVSEKMAELITSDAMTGKGADNIKSYLQTVHLAIMQSLSDLCKSHLQNCLMYKRDYQDNIDTSVHAQIQGDEILEIRRQFSVQQEKIGEVDYRIKNALTGVSDILYTSYKGTEDAENAYEGMKRSLTQLDEDIISLENRHMNEDFAETETLIAELKSFIEEQLSREKNYMSTYTPEVLANSVQYAKLYRANTAMAEKQELRANELQLAYEHESKRIEILEEEAAKKRAEEGWKNGLLALGSIIIGVAAIVGTAGMATPVVATAWVVGGSTIAYGTSNLVEAGQDVYYGTVGDPHTVAVNPIRDTIFCGNQTAYGIWGEVSTTISGLIVPVGQSYTLAKATGQTGKLFASTVGKTVAKELAEDFVIGQVSMGAGSLVQNVTGNASLGTLAGVTAGITAGKSSGKALHSVDNAASGVKSIKQLDSAASGSDINVFIAPEIKTNTKGELTNGIYTLNQKDMLIHVDGKNLNKSQFLYDVDSNKAVLDASAYADANDLWKPSSGNIADFANKAKVPVTNGYVGLTGKGELTSYINVYRTKTGYIHGCPGNP